MKTSGADAQLRIVGVREALFTAVVAILTVATGGCGIIPRGLLYTDTIQPLCRDARGTGLGTKVASLATKAVEIPTTKIDLSAEWSSRAIGDIATRNGMTTVYGCDLRREYYVLGVWRRDEVIVYGE